jgi:hypothetical protein
MHSSTKSQAKRVGESMATKEPAEKSDLPEIRLITQAERNSLDEMVNAVCTKVLGPDWKKRGRRR